MRRGARGRRARGGFTAAAPAAGLALALALASGGARADSLVFCERPQPISATQKDRLLRFAALVKDTLAQTGQRMALVARSGTDLRRLDVRYSHAGIALLDSANGPWSVRQLYFACEEGRPRLFDQGMAGFVFGTDNPRSGYLSLLILPDAPGQALQQAALDNRRSLGLLAATYSANAHAFAVSYQNCNQWVAELLAEAWGLPPAPALPEPAAAVPARRTAAQAWLQAQGYQPHRFEFTWRPVMWLASVLPWLHTDDHPDDDVAAKRLRVSMPDAIEQFVRQQVAGAERIELCHQGQRAVVRRGWQPIAEGCEPADGDQVVPLD